MQDKTTQNIRNTFIDFFKNKNHIHLPYSPLIPINDPSLMFVNSGMVQFKDIFTGQENTTIKKAVTHQKCIRAGGKHNDLENVGHTNRHHTFFEMLGNFSFGDYFKESAIVYAWELLTKVYSLPPAKLLITVHYTDQESYDIWKKLTGFTEEKIIKIHTNDNFWSMGDTGPCGPCSEIFYDHGPHLQGGVPGSKEQDGERYVEIWNIVFMQFAQIDLNTKKELKQKSIDTGMGIERMASVIQGVSDTYQSDLFANLIGLAQEIAKKPYQGKEKIAYKIISDHARSVAFLIADGILPSNEGRGYVLRRIMRRAMRYEYQLGAKQSILQMLATQTISLMHQDYPEIARAKDLILSTIEQESQGFENTLKKGLGVLDKVSKNVKTLSGKIAFELYDTYGFPLDLTQSIMQEQDISVDQNEFETLMKQQQERARKEGVFTQKSESLWFEILNTWGPSQFTQHGTVQGKILALVKDNQIHKSLTAQEDTFFLVTDITPFYAESGGQVGDIGTMFADNVLIKVVDTKKILNKVHVHTVMLEQGVIEAGQELTLQIDLDYRKSVAKNHSATHLLQAVLISQLKDTITQKGSLVAHDRLRFDFNYAKPLSQSEIIAIENKLNEIVMQNLPVLQKYMPLEDAFKEGATALFGEKYEKEVRVISIAKEDQHYSKELCGGTHVNNTGEIGGFKITSESSVASGIRRIEAVTGKYALLNHQKSDSLIKHIADQLGCSFNEIREKIYNLASNNTHLLNINKKLQTELLVWSTDKIASKGVNVNNATLLYEVFNQVDVQILKESAIRSAENKDNAIVIFISKNQEKSTIITSVNEAICKEIDALKLIGIICQIFQTKGGGNKIAAQTGVSTKDFQSLDLLCLVKQKLTF